MRKIWTILIIRLAFIYLLYGRNKIQERQQKKMNSRSRYRAAYLCIKTIKLEGKLQRGPFPDARTRFLSSRSRYIYSLLLFTNKSVNLHPRLTKNDQYPPFSSPFVSRPQMVRLCQKALPITTDVGL